MVKLTKNTKLGDDRPEDVAGTGSCTYAHS